MREIKRPFLLISTVLIAALISGCTLSGAEPAPLTPFESTDDGGAPIADTGGEQPVDGGEQPVDGGEQPADDGAQPTDGGEQPADGADSGVIEPTSSGPIDVFGTQTAEAATTDAGEPVDGGEQPADGGEILPPEDGGEQPADGGEQPADGGEQPADGGEQPADGGEQPADGGEQPADGGEEPAQPTPEPTPVPQPTTAPPPDDSGTGECTYTVQPGDNLFRIAFENGLTTDELAAANGITNPENLQPGTVLLLPLEGCEGVSSGGDASGQTYTVQPGDTLYRIALRFGVTVEALASANGITDPTQIDVGDVLTIP